MKKVKISVRFPNESFYDEIFIDPSEVKNPQIYINEVFFTIYNTRVATLKEEWEKLKINE